MAAWALAPFAPICPFGLTALAISDDFEEDAEWWLGLALASALASIVIWDKHTQQRTYKNESCLYITTEVHLFLNLNKFRLEYK